MTIETLADGDNTMLVHLVYLVGLVYLVYLVYLVSFVQPDRPNRPERGDRPDRPNRPNEQDRLADFFSILLGLQRRFFGQQHRMFHS